MNQPIDFADQSQPHQVLETPQLTDNRTTLSAPASSYKICNRFGAWFTCPICRTEKLATDVCHGYFVPGDWGSPVTSIVDLPDVTLRALIEKHGKLYLDGVPEISDALLDKLADECLRRLSAVVGPGHPDWKPHKIEARVSWKPLPGLEGEEIPSDCDCDCGGPAGHVPNGIWCRK